MDTENQAESYKYWYASAKGALSVILNNSKLSAKKRKNKGRIEAGMHDIDINYLIDIWELQEGRCIYSGIPMNYDNNSYRISIERIENNKGYVKENVVLCCQEFNGLSNWTEEKIEEMLDILESGITEKIACFDKIIVERKKYEKHYCTVIDGFDYHNCTLCGMLKPHDQFNFKIVNGCKDCVVKRTQKTKETPRGMIHALLQIAKISANYRKNKSTAYKRDHTFDIDFNFLVELYNKQKGLCAYSGLPMNFGSYKKKRWVMSLERINPFKGYSRDNVCLICIEFNSCDQSVNLNNPNYGSCAWSKEKFELFLAFVKHKNGLLPDNELPKIVANSTSRNMVHNYRNRHANRPYIRKHELYTKYRNNKYGQVWKLTSPDNKSYIYSTDVLNQKVSQVFHIIKTNRNKSINAEIEKHGEENIKMTIILTCPKDKHEEYKEMMIKEYNTLEPNGLNPKRQHTKDTRDGISTSLSSIVRYDNDGKELPMHMGFISWKDRIGYLIKTHPMQKKPRYFCNTIKEGKVVGRNAPLDTLYQECIAELNKLNAQIEAEKTSASTSASASAEHIKEKSETTKLPIGVYPCGKKIKAQIQYNKKIYVLGTFDANKVDEAYKLYLEYKDKIALEKRGGPKVDIG